MTSNRKIFGTALAGLCLLAAPARAQDDVAAFSTVVEPNVMILLDNSGSMAHLLWVSGFDQKQFYDFGSDADRDGAAEGGGDCAGDNWCGLAFQNCNTGSYNLTSVPVVADSAGFCAGSGEGGNICP